MTHCFLAALSSGVSSLRLMVLVLVMLRCTSYLAAVPWLSSAAERVAAAGAFSGLPSPLAGVERIGCSFELAQAQNARASVTRWRGPAIRLNETHVKCD